MKFLDTKHKRKSAVITAAILALLLLAIFNIGMKYLDPPIEYGVAINFGNAKVGSGDSAENKKQVEKTVPEKKVEEKTVKEPIEKQTVKKNTPKSTREDLITNKTSKEVPVVKKTKSKKETTKKEVSKKEVKKSKPAPPKPSKQASDALNSLLNGNSKGKGNDEKAGVKGDKKGDSNSNKYYGNSKTASGGNYNLAGRKALSKPVKKPDCEEEGTVVVTITVNKSGKVVKAVPGARGTTNSAPCLYKAAKEAAIKTKWNADSKAPNQQKGTIIYKFSLSK